MAPTFILFIPYQRNQKAHITPTVHRGFMTIADGLLVSVPKFVLVYKEQECIACAQSCRIWPADIFLFSTPSQNAPLTLSLVSQHFF